MSRLFQRGAREWIRQLQKAFPKSGTSPAEEAPELLSGSGVIVETLASGLSSPAGIAVDPRNGLVYVAEPTEHRVSVFMGKKQVGSLRENFRIVNSKDWDISPHRDTLARWHHPRFRSPVDLAFDSRGSLYVAESAPGGRILCFNFSGSDPRVACVVALASPDESRMFSAIEFDQHDHLHAISYAVRGRQPAPLVEVHGKHHDDGWQLLQADPALPFPFASGRIGRSGDTVSDTTAGDADFVDPSWESVREWLLANPLLGRIAVDTRSGDVLATMRSPGSVVRVRPMLRRVPGGPGSVT